MVTQPQYPRNEDDEDFLRQFADVADQFVTNVRQEGHKEGRKEGHKEGRQQSLRHLFGLRLQRPLTNAEATLLQRRADELGADHLDELVLNSTAEQLERWLTTAPDEP